jgi:hypothetical protein
MRMKKTSLVLAAIIVGLLFTGCRTATLYNVVQAPVVATASSGISMEGVEKAIVRAGGGLGWRMQKVEEGLIKGTLNLRDHTAVVDIPYTTKEYSIKYTNSNNLKYNASENTIHKNYNGWIQNLDNAIRVRLSML